MRSRVLVILVFALFSASAFGAPPSPGPIEAGNLHPLAQLHLSFAPASPRVLSSGDGEILLGGSLSNTVNREPGSFLVDAESREGVVSVRYGFAERLDFGVKGKLFYRGAGHTDGVIDEWHRLFGLPRGPRRRLEEDDYEIFGSTRSGGTFALERDGAHFGDLELTARYALTSGHFDSTLAVSMLLPSGANEFGQDRTDLGVTLLNGAEAGPGYLAFSSGVIYLGDPEDSGLEFERWRLSGAVHYDWSFAESVSLVTGVIAESGMLANVPRYPDYQIYLDVGIRYRHAQTSVLELLVRENPMPDDSTVDFSLVLNWRLALD